MAINTSSPSDMQETLRVHPVGFMGARQALEDEVIPLSQPLRLLDGRLITGIPVSKGQNIWINIPGYNRLPSLFGENPHEFNIDRWLDGKLDDLPGLVGVYGNLISFGHGPHVCVGKIIPLGSLRVVRANLPQGGDSVFTRCKRFSSNCWRTSSSASPRTTEA
jgi:cytochrome P450